MSLKSILSMGGYGAYVWTAYALAAVVLLYNFFKPWLTSRRIKARLADTHRQGSNS